MDTETKWLWVSAITAAAVAGGVWFMVYRNRSTSTLAPEQVPVTALPGAPPSRDPCRAVFQWDFHLRPEEREGREGARNYPRGTEAVILQAGTIRRNGALMYRVRILRDNAEGWAFVLPAELAGDCLGASEADVRALSARR